MKDITVKLLKMIIYTFRNEMVKVDQGPLKTKTRKTIAAEDMRKQELERKGQIAKRKKGGDESEAPKKERKGLLKRLP